MNLGPFDLTGGPFLTLYLMLFAVTIVAGVVIARVRRPEGQRASVTDSDQLALLTGNRVRFADTVVARLLSNGALAMVGPSLFQARKRELAVSDAERGVVSLPPPIKWSAIENTLKVRAGPIEARMQAGGLLMSDAQLADLRFWATLPYAMLVTFGATKAIIGEARERPTGILTVLLIATVMCGLVRWFTVDRRTRGGRDAVRDALAQSARLKIAPTTPEIPLAVALFGTSVLAGSGYDDFHRLRAASSDGGSGGGDSGSSGDGGGSGGGCGGCGS